MTDALPIKVIAGPQYSFSDSLLPDGARLDQLVTPDRSGIWAHRWGNELVDPPEPVVRGMPWYYRAFLIIPPMLCLLLLLFTAFRKWRALNNQRAVIQFRQSVLAGADPLAQLGIYLHKRINLPPSHFSRENIQKTLAGYDLKNNVQSKLCDWVEHYQARYATDATQHKAVDTAELISLVSSLDKQLPTEKPSGRSGFRSEVRV